MKTKFIILILIAGLLSACGSQPTEPTASASQPTEGPAPATTAPVNPPTSTDTTLPTEPPVVAPTQTSEPAASASVSFNNEISPILQSRCLNCHGGEKTEKSLNLSTYSGLMTGSENGPVINPGDANGSLLIQMIQEGKMPKRGPKLTPPQLQLIIDWINQGALNN